MVIEEKNENSFEKTSKENLVIRRGCKFFCVFE